MKFLIFTLFLFFSITYGEDTDLLPCKCRLNNLNRIVDGKIAPDHSIPWMVSLRYSNYEHFCGGTIVNKKFILTSADCINETKVEDIFIHVGEFNLLNVDLANIYKAKNIFHDKFLSYDKPGDFGLIELERPIEFDTDEIEPACFNLQDDNYEGEFLTAGWGDTASPWFYENEDQSKLRSFPKKDRNLRYYYSYQTLPDKCNNYLFCTIHKDEFAGSCYDDSGGPLMHTEKGITTVIGLFSYMLPRRENNKILICGGTSVFAFIKYYKNLFEKHVGSNYCNVKFIT